MYREASLFKRFGAFLIDNVLLVFIFYFMILILSILLGFSKLEVPQALMEYTLSDQFTTQGMLELINNNVEVAGFFEKILPFLFIVLVLLLVLYIIYFAVIPSKFKDFQTLGRYLTKLNVVDQEGYLVGYKQNFLRLLGDILVVLLNSMMALGYAINIFMLLTRNRTLGDLMAQTKLVDLTKKAEIIIINPDGTITKKEVEEPVVVVEEKEQDSDSNLDN